MAARHQRVITLSNPNLVLLIRKLLTEHATWKLLNGEKEPPTGPLFQAALDEAKKRNIDIQHPELS